MAAGGHSGRHWLYGNFGIVVVLLFLCWGGFGVLGRCAFSFAPPYFDVLFTLVPHAYRLLVVRLHPNVINDKRPDSRHS